MNHKWKTKYVIYPRSAQPLHWMPGIQPGWTRKDTQHFPIFTMTEKLSMLYIPEALRHYTECQDFSLGEPKRKDNFPYINREWKTKYAIYPRRTLHSVPGQTTFISYINLWNMTNNNQNIYIYIYISWYISQKWSGNTKQKNIITGLNFKKMDIFKIKQCWLCHTTMGAHNLKIQMLYC